MAYTVHEVAIISGVTIKTLYHYQKMGLLMPERVAENGYRYYGDQELKRLQQILFYRELDFSLESIKQALENESNRLVCLCEQYAMLKERKQRLVEILNTLEETIEHEQKGTIMNKESMFNGLNKNEWENALFEQNNHLQKTYNFQIDTSNINAEELNKKANEATKFMAFMAKSLKDGVSAESDVVAEAIREHIKFLQQDMKLDANGFAAQSRYLMSDNFHRQMMEGQQTGLSYYICYAAESYAAR